MPGYCFDDVLRFAGLEQIGNDGMAQVVEAEAFQGRRLSSEEDHAQAGRTGLICGAARCTLAGAHRVGQAQGLEGLVATRLDSRYETGLRLGAWQKDARQPRAGICDWRLYSPDEDVRHARVRIYESDRLAGAQAKVEAMIANAKERATKAANRRDSA